MKNYIAPQIELLYLQTQDVITLSVENDEEGKYNYVDIGGLDL